MTPSSSCRFPADRDGGGRCTACTRAATTAYRFARARLPARSSRGAWQHRPAHTAHRWGKRTRRESGPNRNPHGSLSLLSRQLSAIQQTLYARRATAPTPGARQSPRNGPGSAAQRRQLDTAGRGPAPDRAAGQLSSLRGQPAAPPMFTASRGPLLSCSVPRLVGWIGLVSRESGGLQGLSSRLNRPQAGTPVGPINPA
jgi:hypothetical protein